MNYREINVSRAEVLEMQGHWKLGARWEWFDGVHCPVYEKHNRVLNIPEEIIKIGWKAITNGDKTVAVRRREEKDKRNMYEDWWYLSDSDDYSTDDEWRKYRKGQGERPVWKGHETQSTETQTTGKKEGRKKTEGGQANNTTRTKEKAIQTTLKKTKEKGTQTERGKDDKTEEQELEKGKERPKKEEEKELNKKKKEEEKKEREGDKKSEPEEKKERGAEKRKTEEEREEIKEKKTYIKQEEEDDEIEFVMMVQRSKKTKIEKPQEKEKTREEEQKAGPSGHQQQKENEGTRKKKRLRQDPIIARATRDGKLHSYYIETADKRRKDDIQATAGGDIITLAKINQISSRFPEFYKKMSTANVRGGWRRLQAARPLDAMIDIPKREIIRFVLENLDNPDPGHRTNRRRR